MSSIFVSFPQKRNGIVFSSGVNYLHRGGNIQSELSSLVVNVNTAANLLISAQILCIEMQHFNCFLVRHGEIID